MKAVMLLVAGMVLGLVVLTLLAPPATWDRPPPPGVERASAAAPALTTYEAMLAWCVSGEGLTRIKAVRQGSVPHLRDGRTVFVDGAVWEGMRSDARMGLAGALWCDNPNPKGVLTVRRRSDGEVIATLSADGATGI